MGIIGLFIDQTIAAFKGLGNISGFGSFLSVLNDIFWSPPLVLLALGAGVFFTVKTRFVQVRKVKEMAHLLFKGQSSEAGISSFQAFAMAVSGRVGVGNIVGVASAIMYGGPGAMFWMWVVAFLGSTSAFIESTLAQLYKEEINGEYRGGPAYYFRKRGHNTWAIVFSIAIFIAAGIFVPSNNAFAMADAMRANFGGGSNTVFTVALIAGVLLVAIVLFGGTKRIARVAEIVVPVMSVLYIAGALILIIVNIQKLPGMIGLIFSSAFGVHQIIGGSIGWAIMWGVKRGVYSNEGGLGTGAQAAAAGEVSHPAKQGLVQAFSVYFDTLFVCSATGFAILVTGTYQVFDTAAGPGAGGIYNVIQEGIGNVSAFAPELVGSTSAAGSFTPMAFNSLFKGFGGKFVTIGLFFFTFTTIYAFYYYAETNLALLIKDKTEQARKIGIIIYRIVFVFCAIFFSYFGSAFVWTLADLGFALMAWINLIGILSMAKPALVMLRDYEAREKAGTQDEFFTIDSLPEEDRGLFHGVTFWHKK
jgi:AGCS family alanine or glycine:cation symporter